MNNNKKLHDHILDLEKISWDNEETIVVQRIINTMKKTNSIFIPKWVKEIIIDVVWLVARNRERDI